MVPLQHASASSSVRGQAGERTRTIHWVGPVNVLLTSCSAVMAAEMAWPRAPALSARRRNRSSVIAVMLAAGWPPCMIGGSDSTCSTRTRFVEQGFELRSEGDVDAGVAHRRGHDCEAGGLVFAGVIECCAREVGVVDDQLASGRRRFNQPAGCSRGIGDVQEQHSGQDEVEAAAR